MEQIILFGAGNEGINALNFVPKEAIKYFVDNDCKKWGTSLMGVEIMAPSKLMGEKSSVYITTSWKYISEIKEQLISIGITNFNLFQDYNLRIKKKNKKLLSLKGKYAGKRCFLIGTGPSLKMEDLEKLKSNGEICFASNKIFKLYDKTDWRPNLYCISDLDVFHFYYDTICNMETEHMFLVNIAGSKYKNTIDIGKLNSNNKYIFDILYEKRMNKENEFVPAFSIKPERYVVDGGITVTYSMLQFVYFLGFKEVYLLGIDFSYGDLSGEDKNKNDHFCTDYIATGEVVNYPKIKDSLEAYEVAEEFSLMNGFRIYNATRGGKLEVFERVDFDRLMEKELK